MPTTEPTINDAIAKILRRTRRAWRAPEIVRSENTGMLRGTAGRPDILVMEANVSPVVIETELLPAITVEREATSRLGKHIRTNGRVILSSIAVRLPRRLRTKDGTPLARDLATLDDIEMALFTGSTEVDSVRWPHSGWITGSIAELSTLVQSASVPPEVIEHAANLLVTSVSEAAGLFREMAASHPGAAQQIGERLRQEDGEQTRRMAATILTNAFVFQETLAGGTGDLASVNNLAQLRAAN